MSPVDRAELLAAFQIRLGHTFADPDLLEQAFIHPSFAHEQGVDHNQRLEFLGDAALHAIISHACFTRYPHASDGALSAQKHRLVSGETLAAIGRELGLATLLKLGTGAQRESINQNPSTLEDATEALIGALLLDAGFDKTASLTVPWFEPFMRDPTESSAAGSGYKNAITLLHEACDRKPVRSRAHPITLSREGQAHEPLWQVGWWCGGKLLASSWGTSKKAAERHAARLALEQLRELVDGGWIPDRQAEPPSDPADLPVVEAS